MNNSVCQQFHQQVPTQIEALNDVLHWFEEEIAPLLPERCGWEVKIALSEAFTNTVRYAHQSLPPNIPIAIDIQVCDHQIEVKIWDFGQPFDITAKLETLQKNAQDPLEKESERGLFLMNTIMDELQSLRIENRNCLVMRKAF